MHRAPRGYAHFNFLFNPRFPLAECLKLDHLVGLQGLFLRVVRIANLIRVGVFVLRASQGLLGDDRRGHAGRGIGRGN